ncbi:MAG: lysophospholipid acyltransferase family protein [Syntrophales bacterium]|nr:lysophospholipid acyltransferase family protein [Syntrophales bacterium]
MIRSAFLVAISVVITAFISSYVIVLALLRVPENSLHKVARIWASILLRLSGVKVETVGLENILDGRAQIFMSNHQSDFDILIVLAFIPGQFRWIAKKELFRIPAFGRAMRNAGYIEMDRQNHEKALRSLEIASQKIREGRSVMSFPEGTRSRDGKIKDFKQGLFHLALQAGVPIVPISIIGASEIMPKRSLMVNPGRITMVIGEPVDASQYSAETRHELMGKVRGTIVDNFNAWQRPGGPMAV